MEFGSSCERDDVLDAFEDKAKKIFEDAGLAALKEAGYKATRSRAAGSVVVRKNHGRGQNWDHYFHIDASASHV